MYEQNLSMRTVLDFFVFKDQVVKEEEIFETGCPLPQNIYIVMIYEGSRDTSNIFSKNMLSLHSWNLNPKLWTNIGLYIKEKI